MSSERPTLPPISRILARVPPVTPDKVHRAHTLNTQVNSSPTDTKPMVFSRHLPPPFRTTDAPGYALYKPGPVSHAPASSANTHLGARTTNTTAAAAVPAPARTAAPAPLPEPVDIKPTLDVKPNIIIAESGNKPGYRTDHQLHFLATSGTVADRRGHTLVCAYCQAQISYGQGRRTGLDPFLGHLAEEHRLEEKVLMAQYKTKFRSL